MRLQVRHQRRREPIEQRRGRRERNEDRQQRRLADEQRQLRLEEQHVDVPVSELRRRPIRLGRRHAVDSVKNLLRPTHEQHRRQSPNSNTLDGNNPASADGRERRLSAYSGASRCDYETSSSGVSAAARS